GKKAPKTAVKTPPYLKPGDAIGIFCPAGFISIPEIQPSILQIESWGFKVIVGDTVGKKDFSFGGTDNERAADFQRMLDDPKIKAIMCARGGYGFVRIIDRINFKKFLKEPKWIIGFSDVTVLHCHLNALYGTPSIHAKMCNSFPDNWASAEPIQVETILSIRNALQGRKMSYPFPSHPMNRIGRADGILIGGNLRTIENMAGTASDFNTENKILFVEDTGEYLYSVDRMFRNLLRTGKLEKLKGLVVGGFRLKAEDPGDEFGRSLYQIVQEITKADKYPVCFEFPVGHQKNNFALKCGIRHRLEVNRGNCLMHEI
ncbi:MAG: LD-carboxypeptidase, partial [Chitinophagaceae bacterium]